MATRPALELFVAPLSFIILNSLENQIPVLAGATQEVRTRVRTYVRTSYSASRNNTTG